MKTSNKLMPRKLIIFLIEYFERDRRILAIIKLN